VTEIQPLTPELIPDALTLFGTSTGTARCFCMWFIIPVKQYHAGGPDRNRELFCGLVTDSTLPAGLLAYRSGEPVGWCAVGPRSRYARAIETPSFKGRDPSEDEAVWLVPCFYVRKDARRSGVSRALLQAAVDVAKEHGATAIEGFPFARGMRPSPESMVGGETAFAACGFRVDRRPTATRVVTRLDLGG
jgi:GNAT superfamily N-acetyltransferase